MKKVCFRLIFAGWMLALAGFAVAEQVDPRFPADRPAIPPEEWTRWPRARVRQLEAERDQLLKKTSILPQHNPKALSDHLGYHSLFEEPVSDGSLSPHQIDIEMSWAPYLDSIALIPSFKSTGSGVAAYAFPKRFKIEVLDTKTGDYEIVVNWMDEDFPDPGPYPVFFSEINRPVKRVRITILPMVQESGAAYFALGEIYMFQQEAGGRVGANMATWGSNFIKITSSGSFRQLPLWDTQYLNDDVQGLGFPLSDETVSVPDFLIKYEDGMPFSGKAQFMLDLGKPRVVGRIDFWPAAAPYEVEVPSFGFPQAISVKVSDDPDFKTGKQLNFQSFRGKLLSVTGEGINARYVHITMEGLDEYKGMPILGLGEISVSRGDRAASVGCKVVAQGIPDRCQDQLALLVDGISRQRRILPQGEWIRGLAQRRPLDRRLAVVERELELARTAWQHIKQRSIIWMGIILSMGLIGGLVVQQRMRKRGIAKLKGRIARDLHDDVGSNLGSISLTAEQLKHVVVDAEVKEELCDLSLMARDSGILPSTVNINVRRVGSRVADATTVIYSCGDRRKW